LLTSILPASSIDGEILPMQNNWNDDKAATYIERYAEQGVNEDLALRVYTTRLLGRNPELVLHGGGNTSVKTIATDLFGQKLDVLCVKGSGWDMAEIEPAGLPAVRLQPLQQLKQLDVLSDEDMVGFQRANLLDQSSPNPSVETLLHGFLPHKYIDHAHANAVLSISDQANGVELCREVYGEEMGIVPYVMPGFALSKLAHEVYVQNPSVKGLILHKHGIFTFGDTAREAYDRMVDMTSWAEQRIAKAVKKVFPTAKPVKNPAALHDILPIVRGANAISQGDGKYSRWITEFRTNARLREYVSQENLEAHPWTGVITPDHIIRIKNKALVLPAADANDLDGYKVQVKARIADYVAAYHAYFATNNAKLGGIKVELDPMPRAFLVPGLGILGMGKSKKDAGIAADLIERAIATVMDAQSVGAFEPLPDCELFDMEYWSLEQAKLAKGEEKPLARQVVAITGGAGAIGAATAKAMADAGAEVVILDLDETAAVRTAAQIAPTALGLACDVTDEASVAAAFACIAGQFGGVDIVVSNAGAAWQGNIAELDDETLRKSFELNFFGHQRVAQAAASIMKAQGTGGALLFNTSKQAINPGADFGAYGLPKAATLFLSRQYAIDLGRYGIRANAVNADRIRSGLLDDEMVATRAKARGLSEAEYMGGNLLGLEVTADDVAQAFVHQALALKTTANVTTVDGGNIAASLR
jgi:rhamnose utilization protein RhaD (predicted bifunctional aldolase and dehydrogenase)/NAD(P)-dependent dehydrogenase (short-subunit alcohol dehydrogenase family)